MDTIDLDDGYSVLQSIDSDGGLWIGGTIHQAQSIRRFLRQKTHQSFDSNDPYWFLTGGDSFRAMIRATLQQREPDHEFLDASRPESKILRLRHSALDEPVVVQSEFEYKRFVTTHPLQPLNGKPIARVGDSLHHDAPTSSSKFQALRDNEHESGHSPSRGV